MNFSFPTPVDQCNHQALDGGVAEEETRKGDESVAHPLHLLVVEHSTWRGEVGKDVERLEAALGCVAATCFRNTPSKVEVSGRVCEGGGEAKNEDVEEPAHLSMGKVSFNRMRTELISPSNASSNL